MVFSELKKSCRVEQCKNDMVAKDLCNKHYKAFKKYGDPEKRISRPKGSNPRTTYGGCARCEAGLFHNFKHGTLNGYRYHSCRCVLCKKAIRNQNRIDRRDNYETVRARESRRVRQPAKRVYQETEDNKRRKQEKRAHVNITRTRRDPWSITEDVIVQRSDVTLLEMAHMLGRSYSAVAVRRHFLSSSARKITS